MDDRSVVGPLDRSTLDVANDTLVAAFMDDSMVGLEEAILGKDGPPAWAMRRDGTPQNAA